MSALWDTHVRPGALASAGRKHTRPETAILELLDDAVEQKGGKGAQHVLICAGVNTQLKGDFVIVADNGVGMKGRESIEWNLLAEGPEELPKGDDAVAFFNTGHVAALSALGHEVIIATARDGVGTLVRWGQPVTDAVHREEGGAPPNERTLKNAAIEFDMRTGALRICQPKNAVERADAALSEACFGLSPAHARLALADSFPMDDVTPEKLFSLFAPLYECNHGTVVYFTSRADASSGAPLVAPTPDGMSVRAGGVALHDFLPRAWMLPRSAAMPVEADYGAAVKRNKLHFVVKLQGPRGMTEVDFGRHPWQRVVAEGYASPAMTLQVPYGGDKVATVHVQFGWLEDDADAGIYLHRHKRFAKMEPHVHRLDSADAGALRQRIASGGPAQQVAAYDVLCRIYGGASPLTKAQLKEHTGSELQRMFGKCQITLVSCHDFAWQEGKEAFMQNALYDRILSAVRVASARYALEHPWPEEYAAKERAARQARGIATRKANAPQRAAAAPADESPASGGSSPTSDDDDDDSSSGEAAGPSTPAGAGAGGVPTRQLRARGVVSVKKSKVLDPMRYGEDTAPSAAAAQPKAKKRASGKKRSAPPPAGSAAAQLACLRRQLCAVRGISKRCKAQWQRVKRARRVSDPAVVAFAEGFISDLEDALEEDV